jgi:protein TonB
MEKKKKKKFLKLPKYPGGNVDFKKFFEDNMIYPKQALENKIEGFVYLTYDVDHLGNVIDAKVIKGLDYGCDEEALRLVKMLKYEKSKNRGVKVTASMKVKVLFKLKNYLKINYQVKIQKDKRAPNTYSYTIEL